VRPAPNLVTEPGGFRIDPVAQLAAEREADRGGLRVLGAWHSHPGGTREPSRRDLVGAAYPLVLVTALARGDAALLAWWVAGGVPVGLPVVESGPAAFSGGARRPKG
jgi:proteasome lid subunit RPN8/RPN11